MGFTFSNRTNTLWECDYYPGYFIGGRHGSSLWKAIPQ